VNGEGSLAGFHPSTSESHEGLFFIDAISPEKAVFGTATNDNNPKDMIMT
jgi:hypothetical protein